MSRCFFGRIRSRMRGVFRTIGGGHSSSQAEPVESEFNVVDGKQSPEESSFFDGDRPIERLEDDRLNRRPFAESIARSILDAPSENGFTVAIIGEWGSGKTSVMNMIAEELRKNPTETAVLTFNPWLSGGTAELVARFFNELSTQLNEGDWEKLKDFARVLAGLGRTLAPLSTLPGAGAAAAVAGAAVDQWTEPKSLLSQRDSLRKILKESGTRIVVLIDDIDRLEPDETRRLMRVVRLTSDLPHLVFLLAFDRRHVANSLGTTESEGQQYLEKIVQVSHNLPVLREHVLPDMYLSRLNELILEWELNGPNREAWGRIFPEIIRPLLRNLRNIKRYLYSLPVTLDLVGNEIELADLLGLEAIRILKPALFEELKTHPECLVRCRSDWRLAAGFEDRKQEIQVALEAMLKRAGDDREILNAALEILVPATQEFVGVFPHGASWDPIWRRDRRVACEEVFRIYLSGGLDETTIPADDISDMVSLMADESRVVPMLESLDGERLEQTIERLEDFEGEFPEQAAVVVVPVLINKMGFLSDEWSGLLSFSPRFKATRVIYRLLRRVQNRETLAGYIAEMLPKANSLSGRLCLIEMVGHRESVGTGLVSEEWAAQLEAGLLEQLVTATAEELALEWDLIGLSLRPILWNHGEEKLRIAQRYSEYLINDNFVFALLRSGAGYAYSSRGMRQKRLPWGALADSFGETLAEAVTRLAESELYPDLLEHDKDTVQLALLYARGGEPTEWEDIP